MKSIGLDIGTTTICAVLIDANSGTLLDSVTIENTSTLTGHNAFEKLQDPAIILKICKTIITSYCLHHTDIISIGITGQMHGILYLDKEGNAVSPLYTWQDRRGDEKFENSHSYAQYMSETTGFSMATGYGLTTHFYNTIQHVVPLTASTLCTISDYVAMQLVNRKKPLLHKSMAASIGLYQLEKDSFSLEAFQKLMLSPDILPEVAKEDCVIGSMENNISVSIALGDNQASFLASVNDDNSCLINVGTGSQVSLCTKNLKIFSQIECRPFIADKYLFAGSSLCGGYSYTRLKQFFEESLSAFGLDSTLVNYDTMNKLAQNIYGTNNYLKVDTRFRGTRIDPTITGSVMNLNDQNFQPSYLILGVLQGICDELYHYYTELYQGSSKPSFLIGSGNGIRKNPLLQQLFTDTFHLPLKIPAIKEEASFGSALFSLYTCNYLSSIEEIHQRIKYLNLGGNNNELN